MAIKMVGENQEIFDLVVSTTVGAITNFAKKTKEAEFQILDILMPKERKIRSIVGGLETSLGTTLWEPLVKNIAASNGFKVIDGKALLAPTNIPENILNVLNLVISSRENPNSTYDANTSRDTIKEACAPLIKDPIKEFHKPPPGKGVDIWLKKDGINYFSDSKTVQPNVGSYKDFLRQIMTWYAYYYCRAPEGEARAFIFMPYNPYKGDFLKNTVNHGFPLLKEELWVQDDLWDFCSGVKNTFAIIISAFEYIRDNKLVTKELDSLFHPL